MQSPIERAKHTLDSTAAYLTQRNHMLAGLLAFIACMLGFQWLQLHLGAPMLDMMAAYERDQLTERMLIYGDEGRLLHARFTLWLDMVFPFVYGAFFAGLMHVAHRGAFVTGGVLAIVALMLVDWLENLQLLALLWGFPDLSDAQISAASATTQGKTAAVQFVLLWLLGGFLLRVVHRLRG